MNIYQIKTGILPIPPNGHGAIEKIIWEYNLTLNDLNNVCDIEYLDYIDSEHDVVHIHVANLALLAHERGIPYYFTCHDHHAYLYGKDSHVFKENYDAIKHSIHSFVPAKFLVDYFDLPNLSYLSHGVNSDVFKFKNKKNQKHRLLCVANNGFIHDQSHDRKGFGFAIEAAKKLNLPITIVGPENNKSFFDKYDPNYDKLIIKYNLTESELVQEYSNHTIFLHPSILEAGHPNLTLLEALSCGLPVVGTYEPNNSLDGMIKVNRDVDEISTAITTIINDYENYQTRSQKCVQKYTWESVCNTLLKYYKNEYNHMKEQLIKEYTSTKIYNRKPIEVQNTLKVTFNEGARVEIQGSLDKRYNIKFKDPNNNIIHETEISTNMWTCTNVKYLIKYNIDITELDTGLVMTYKFDLKSKRVKIINESPSLGDNIAWMPVIDEFQKLHDCEVHYFTPLKDLYEENYKNIKFFDYNSDTTHDYYATYKIGCFTDPTLTRADNRLLNLQSIVSSILDMDFVETKPKLIRKNKSRPITDKYVCISTASTAGCKHWQNKTGWQQTVDYLNTLGYKVVVIQKEALDYMDNKMLQNVVHPTISNLHDAINWLSHCEFYIGLGSGFSWVNWALDNKVILINGFAKPFTEFYTPYRVINTNSCHGCWNNTKHTFDPSNWNWCPENKNFECSKTITFDMVKEKIDEILKIN